MGTHLRCCRKHEHGIALGDVDQAESLTGASLSPETHENILYVTVGESDHEMTRNIMNTPKDPLVALFEGQRDAARVWRGLFDPYDLGIVPKHLTYWTRVACLESPLRHGPVNEPCFSGDSLSCCWLRRLHQSCVSSEWTTPGSDEHISFIRPRAVDWIARIP